MSEIIIKKTNITIKAALKLLSKTGEKCLIIVNKNNKLVGTLSDGDIRKAIISNKNLNSTINKIYQKNPSFLIFNKYTNEEVKKIFLDKKLDLIPVVNSKKQVIEVLKWDKYFKNQSFTKIKNPYFYGEVSISRTARYSPAVFVFKPLMILTAFLLLFYWVNILYFFNDTKINDETNKFSKKFFYFGILSCVFLILHVIFLGVSYDSELFQKMRRIIIILFILFELCAQIFLTQSLFKFRNELKSYINPLILKIKIIFVSIAFFITCVSFVILVFYDPSTAFKHVLEGNYFTLLLFYYILSRLLFR